MLRLLTSRPSRCPPSIFVGWSPSAMDQPCALCSWCARVHASSTSWVCYCFVARWLSTVDCSRCEAPAIEAGIWHLPCWSRMMNGIHGSDTVVMEIGGKRVEEEGEESRAVQISDAKIIDLHFIGFYFFPGTQNTLTRRRIYNHFSHFQCGASRQRPRIARWDTSEINYLCASALSSFCACALTFQQNLHLQSSLCSVAWYRWPCRWCRCLAAAAAAVTGGAVAGSFQLSVARCASVDCCGAPTASFAVELDSMFVGLDSMAVGGSDCRFDCAPATMVDSNAATWLEAEIVSKRKKKGEFRLVNGCGCEVETELHGCIWHLHPSVPFEIRSVRRSGVPMAAAS